LTTGHGTPGPGAPVMRPASIRMLHLAPSGQGGRVSRGLDLRGLSDVHKRTGSRSRWPHDEGVGSAAPQAKQESSAAKVAEGQRVFRFETFGDEQLWTDRLRLRGGVDKNVDPTTALGSGSKWTPPCCPPGSSKRWISGVQPRRSRWQWEHSRMAGYLPIGAS